MKVNWKDMKSIIRTVSGRSDLYLTLMNEDGTIACANARMLKGFSIKDPRSASSNFLDLVHPIHINDFKKTVSHVAQNKDAASVELYIRNGIYHPMKWVVNYLPRSEGAGRQFFCLGYKILDEERQKKFNSLVEKHYQLIMEGLTGIIFHNRDGDLIATNQQTANIFHTSLERLYQLKNIRDLWDSKWQITDEDGQPLPFEQSPFMKAKETGKPQKEVLYISLENGESRWILFNSQPFPEDNRENMPCCVVSNIIDITRERLLAIRVKEKTAFINAFIRQTPNLAWIIDENMRLIIASDAFFHYFGIEGKQSLGKKISELVPASVFSALYEKHIEVMETGRSVRMHEKVKMANGSNYISHINIFPIDETPGKILVGGYAVNLPDTKHIEAELRQANDRLLALSHAAANAIWEWDMQTGRIYRNESLMEMIGYHRDDSKGLSWWLRRIHPQDRNRISDKVKEATDNCLHSWQDEYRFKCANGEYKHIRDNGFIIYENGLPVKMIGSLQDISNLKELENKLAREKLDRQKEISETIIRVQEKERTRIGHELHDNVNQVLSIAKLFVDMLEPAGRNQKQAKAKGLQYLSEAIDEIRKLSRDLVVPQFKDQGLVNSIQCIIDDMHLTTPVQIKFIHDLETDLLSSGKKITIFRIVQEQLKNIVAHSKAKNAAIFLQVKQDNVQLIIKDDGIGFDSSQTYRGIGLSNIYERINFYNGTVDIETAPRKGCMVTVTLPLL